MKCNNCNKDIEAGSKFCTNCGELVPVETNKPLAEATPTTETNPIENKQDKPSFNGKLLIPVAIIAVLVIGSFTLIPKLGGNKPEKVVYSVFESIDSLNANKFLDTLTAEAKNELLHYAGFDMVEVAGVLFESKEKITYTLGPDWLKKINLTLVYKDDLQALVNISFDGYSENIQLIKENKKWKINDNPF